MLSICIPVFNYDASKLLEQLHKQCLNLDIQFEIIILEDGSDLDCINDISYLDFTKQIILETNCGRSKARNILAENAIYQKILFLDCDSEIPSNCFIKKYIENLNKTVVCGGTKYYPRQYSRDKSLRYTYGIKREMIKSENRNKNPNKSFTTNNFLISKSVFNKIKFREFLTKYGHEDSLFGYELQCVGIDIYHIDNPVIHCGLEENEFFLKKTKIAIKNIFEIETSTQIDKDFFNTINLVVAYRKYKNYGLTMFVKLFFNIFEKAMNNYIVKSKKPYLFIFDIYKLGYYINLIDNGGRNIETT